MIQGDSATLDFKITNDGTVVAPADITKIEFIIFDYRKNKRPAAVYYDWYDDNNYQFVKKTYPDDNITFDTDHFEVPLTQRETMRFGNLVEMQARVLFTDGSIKLSKIVKKQIEPSLFNEVMDVD